MAPRYRDPDDLDTPETHGGEAGPRPLKSRRLVDMMDTSSKGKGRRKPATAAPSRREKVTPSAVPEPTVFGRGEGDQDLPQATPSKRIAPKQPSSQKTVLKPTSLKETAPQILAGHNPLDLPSDARAVLSVTPEGEGETVTVVLALPDPEGKKAQRVSFHLLVEQYAELGVKTGEITPEYADTLLDAGKLCGAIRRGISLLGYGDQSARRLAYKLTAKGVDRDTAARAVAYLTERGYIREESTATLRARQGVGKGWGERRIREDLIAHGFTREAVEEAMENISDTDWEENCTEAIRKKYGEIPEDRGERQKLMAAMVRLGYDTDTVKEAMRTILREN